MIKKKVILLGTFGVGKTSLVRNYVHSIFSDTYLSTIGVKIDQKDLTVNNKDLRLVIWDIHGEDEYQKIQNTYLIGTAGYFLVADSTRSATLDKLIELKDRMDSIKKDIPFILLLNKCDLEEMVEISETYLDTLRSKNWIIHSTSAKTGEGVEEAFQHLANLMLIDV